MSLHLAERFERVMALIRKDNSRLTQADMLQKLNEISNKKISQSSISKLLNGSSTIGPRLEVEIADALEIFIKKLGFNERSIANVPLRNLIKTNRRIDLRQTDNSQKIPSVYKGVWLGVHYPTIRLEECETEVSTEEVRTFILIYDDEKPLKRGFSIYGNSTYFTGTMDYSSNKAYYYGFEKHNKNENVFIIMHDAGNASANDILEHRGIISGIGQGGVQAGHIFSVKLYMMKLNIDEEISVFRSKLLTNTSFKSGWCGRFRINRSGWKTKNLHDLERAVDNYISMVNIKSSEDVGERLFIL